MGPLGIILAFLALGCATSHKPVVWTAQNALRPAEAPDFADDQDFAGLEQSLNDHIEYYRKSRKAKSVESLQFGPTTVPAEQYVQALESLREQLKAASPEKVKKFLRERFTCHQVAGDGKWGEAFITSYFDPVFPASLKPTARLSRPVYLVPKDMALIRLDEFRQVFPHWSIFNVTEQKSATPLARGRIYKRSGVNFVVPYYSRFELDSLGLLRGQGYEIAYADPIDIFVMQIQGSGTLQLANGKKIRVGYSAQNGHPYVPIGKFLKDRIKPEEMSLQAIEKVLRQMPPEESQAIMDLNPSYVFFEVLKSEPRTTLGTVVRPGRTIATDRQYFPKGTLAYVQFEKPIFPSAQAEQPQSWLPVGRLVIDQDTGGAIRGTGRLDLYWGRGDEAKQAAGVMKQWGKLCYLVPR
ncbi:MAG: MltA domain-containing protein [Bdellovibrionales bacterium]